MRLFLKKAGMSIFLLLLAATGVRAQNPTYLCELRNDHQVDARTFDFDVYLLRTGTTAFELTNMQFGININAGARNGGNITVSLVSGTSGLKANQIPTENKLTFTTAKNSINMTAKLGPGVGEGTIISNAGFGTRVGTIRITNSVNFGTVRPNLKWGWAIPKVNVITKVSAYDCIATEITVQASHTIIHLVNAELNPLVTPPAIYAVTNSGSYCRGGIGLPVGLANSEAGVTYTLYKNLVAQVPTVVGTGSPISFGNQLAETYTITGTNGCSTTAMTGSAVITENEALDPPTGIAVQTFCSSASPKVASLKAAGTNIQWYADYSGGSPLIESTVLVNNAHYYATTTVNSCESTTRLFVTAIVTSTPAPTGISAQSFCSGFLNTVACLTATGTGIQWYSDHIGGSPLSASTVLVNNAHYYATTTVNNCESASRFDVTATENASYVLLSDTEPIKSISGIAVVKPTSKDSVSIKDSVRYTSVESTHVIFNSQSVSSFKIYPNPSGGLFDINIETNGTETFDIEVFSSMGALVWKKEAVLIDRFYSTQVDLNGSHSGTYMVVLRNKVIRIVKKAIILL